jgi:hypothetical protein
MRLHGKVLALAVVVLAGTTGSCAGSRALSAPPMLNEHAVRLDGKRRLLSWWAGDAPGA